MVLPVLQRNACRRRQAHYVDFSMRMIMTVSVVCRNRAVLA
jgi:hypothetical protein